MKKIKNQYKIFVLGAIVTVCLLNVRKILADDTDCSVLTGDAKDQCENLEKKAQVYQDLIDLKNKQQDTLQNQLQAIDRDQNKNKNDLQKTQAEAENLVEQINSAERDIAEKEKYINTQKVILSGLIQSYYEYDQQGVLNVVLLNKDFSEIVSDTDYIEQSGTKVNEVLGEIISAKDELEAGRNELVKKRDDLNKIKQDLIEKNDNLQNSEQQKQSLMDKTQGEEEKYKQLLAHVEEQQKELFDFSSASNSAEVSASVSSYPKPSSNLASTSWYYSQRDSRWGNSKIGNSNTYMKSYGCAVTCVSMVFRKYGASIDPGKMARQKIFYYDLIKWPSSWTGGINLVSSIGHGNISWSKIDSEISSGHPVIVYIKKTNGGGGHYVVVTGKDSKDYIVHDPYFGANLYLGTSKALVGKIGVDSKVSVDQMIIYE
jgi:peptidoglycan hydrolase CwlO-like protein